MVPQALASKTPLPVKNQNIETQHPKSALNFDSKFETKQKKKTKTKKLKIKATEAAPSKKFYEYDWLRTFDFAPELPEVFKVTRKPRKTWFL